MKARQPLTHGSLFSGIGGFDISAEIAGWTNLFNCEINPFCQTVLKYHFPNETAYSNILETDFSEWRGRVDVLSGGFPCQPFSQAGKRRGTDDDRHLWPAMLGAIRQIRPRWVVGENVLGIINWNDGMVFEQVCADLEAEGYEVRPFVLPACGVDAPHQRYRTWFIAHSQRDLHSPEERGGHGETEDVPSKHWPEKRSAGKPGRADNDNDEGLFKNRHECFAPDADTDKCESGDQFQEPLRRSVVADGGNDDYSHADGTGFQMQGEKQPTTRTAGICTGASGYCGKQSSSDSGTEFWRNFPTQSPVRRGDDGFSEWLDTDAVFKGASRSGRASVFNRWRQESVKAYGNAVVPPLVCMIFEAINRYEMLENSEN